MKVNQVLSCSFSSWYEKFKNVTWKSVVIPLSQEFVDYLLQDGLILPQETNNNVTTSAVGEDEDEVDWNDDDENDGNNVVIEFPELNDRIKSVIARFGGGVFPKLNWSSAKDATWISLNNSLKCSVPSDVYLLLKSSEFITHDLTQPFKDCEDTEAASVTVPYELILRKWIDVNPALEFRCFVKDNELIAISQRDYTNFHAYINKEEEDIVCDIVSFFYDKICERFPDSDYVFDVYREAQGSVKLVDFNPFGHTTDALLFEWEELNTENHIQNTSGLPLFKFVKDNNGVQPNPYRYYSIPRDFGRLNTGENPYELLDALKMSTNPTTDDASDDDS